MVALATVIVTVAVRFAVVPVPKANLKLPRPMVGVVRVSGPSVWVPLPAPPEAWLWATPPEDDPGAHDAKGEGALCNHQVPEPLGPGSTVVPDRETVLTRGSGRHSAVERCKNGRASRDREEELAIVRIH